MHVAHHDRALAERAVDAWREVSEQLTLHSTSAPVTASVVQLLVGQYVCVMLGVIAGDTGEPCAITLRQCTRRAGLCFACF